MALSKNAIHRYEQKKTSGHPSNFEEFQPHSNKGTLPLGLSQE